MKYSAWAAVVAMSAFGAALGGAKPHSDRPPRAGKLMLAKQKIDLFHPALLGDGSGGGLRIAHDAMGQLRAYKITGSKAPIVTEPFQLRAHGVVSLSLTPFDVITPDARFVVVREGGKQEALAFDPSTIITLRGEIIGKPESHVYLAISEHGAAGVFEFGAGQGRLVLAADDGRRGDRGLARGALRAVEASGFGAPPLVEVCQMRVHDEGGQADAPAGLAGVPGDSGPKQLQIAVDTDHEYFQLFGNADDAAAYTVALYGAMSDIYQRDVNTRVQVSFLRLWETPDDLFNEPDPLGPFRTHWNTTMQAVQRDTAQLLTARRNLPYGGVAWLNGLCNSFSYSVAGWMIGSFAGAAESNAANWDLVVAAHEVGHNCGTFHSHDYGLDFCSTGQTRRGCIMSYCHTTSGGNSNIDLRFHTHIQGIMKNYINNQTCIATDCNGNNQSDLLDIATGLAFDLNNNGVPDECEDCNGNGVFDNEDILFGTSNDLNFNGAPDECESDCNRNGLPDSLDIANRTSADANGNGVPDQCEADCNGNGQSDYAEIQANMELDVDRNAALDACQDCDGDGVNDLAQLGGALNIWVAGFTPDANLPKGGGGTLGAPLLREFHARSGAPVKTSAWAPAASNQVQDLLITRAPLPRILASMGDRVAMLDAITGAPLNDFIAPGSGGLSDAAGMAFGPDGHLYVASRGNSGGAVLRFHGVTGASLGTFVAPGAPSGGLIDPFGLAFRASGPAPANLLVTSADDRVLEFNGSTGAFVRVLVGAGSGTPPLTQPRGILLTPEGRLLVASFGSNAILEFDGLSGAFIRRFDQGGPVNGTWGLRQPWTLRLGRLPNLPHAPTHAPPLGNDVVFVSSSAGSTAVHAYNLQTGLFMRSYYIFAMEVRNPTAFDVMPPPAAEIDCNMNLVPDACDIASGASRDTNNNGMPDECEATPAIPGDVTGDGAVNVDDLLALIAAWGPCPPPPTQPPISCPADIAPAPNGNGVVNVDDLLFLIANWGG